MLARPGNRFLRPGPQDWLTRPGSRLTRMPVCRTTRESKPTLTVRSRWHVQSSFFDLDESTR